MGERGHPDLARAGETEPLGDRAVLFVTRACSPLDRGIQPNRIMCNIGRLRSCTREPLETWLSLLVV